MGAENALKNDAARNNQNELQFSHAPLASYCYEDFNKILIFTYATSKQGLHSYSPHENK